MSKKDYELIGEDRLDSRDLIEVADEMRERATCGECLARTYRNEECVCEDDDGTAEELDADELALLHAIQEVESAGIKDFPYGATLVREDCFEDHARELAGDIGAIDVDANWPLSYIDWPAAADALKADYTTVEFLGHTYYVR